MLKTLHPPTSSAQTRAGGQPLTPRSGGDQQAEADECEPQQERRADESDEGLRDWVERGVAYAESLPPKKKKKKRKLN